LKAVWQELTLTAPLAQRLSHSGKLLYSFALSSQRH